MISRQKLIEYVQLEIEHYTDGGNLTTEEKGIVKGLERLEAIIHDYEVEITQPPADQWIPCSERLPENHHTVLACTINGIVHENNFMGKDWFFFRGGGIIAWMPLPEPYKGAE